MTVAVFVDANVFIYACQDSEPVKQPIAAQWLQQLWRDRLGRTSAQVISETYVTLTRKIRPPIESADAWDYVSALFAWGPQAVDAPVIQRAREIEQRYRLAWWDCLIVASAQLQNCPLLLSEDLQDGAVYGSVTVRSPFKLGLSEPRAAYASIPNVTLPYRPRGRPKRAGA